MKFQQFSFGQIRIDGIEFVATEQAIALLKQNPSDTKGFKGAIGSSPAEGSFPEWRSVYVHTGSGRQN